MPTQRGSFGGATCTKVRRHHVSILVLWRFDCHGAGSWHGRHAGEFPSAVIWDGTVTGAGGLNVGVGTSDSRLPRLPEVLVHVSSVIFVCLWLGPFGHGSNGVRGRRDWLRCGSTEGGTSLANRAPDRSACAIGTFTPRER